MKMLIYSLYKDIHYDEDRPENSDVDLWRKIMFIFDPSYNTMICFFSTCSIRANRRY